MKSIHNWAWILFEEIQRSHSQNCTYERSLYTTVKMIPIKHFKLERELCGSLRSRRIKGRGWGRRERIRGKKHILLHPLPFIRATQATLLLQATLRYLLRYVLRLYLHICAKICIFACADSSFRASFPRCSSYNFSTCWTIVCMQLFVDHRAGQVALCLIIVELRLLAWGPKWTMQIRRSTELLSHVYSVFPHYFVNYVSDTTNKRLL